MVNHMITAGLSLLGLSPAPATHRYTFHEYQQLCEQALKQKTKEPIVSYAHLQETLTQLSGVMQAQTNCPAAWLCAPRRDPSDRFLLSNSFSPYVQRLHVPEGSIVFFHGDLHANVHALNTCLAHLASRGYLEPQDPFRIRDSRVYLVFLGDYTDRGLWGIETWYTIARLKIANPDRVYMVRGNHEDITLNEHYGFSAELIHKYGPAMARKLLTQLDGLYNTLPVALYLGMGHAQARDYILCCHGGWEMGYRPWAFLQAPERISYQRLDTLQRHTVFCELPVHLRQEIATHIPLHEYHKDICPTSPTYPVSLGFMWDDFIPDQGEHSVGYTQGRGWRWGKPLLDAVRISPDARVHIRAVFRAHQHGDPALMPLMLKHGVAKLWKPAGQPADGLWDGMVCTFLVAPNTGYGNTFDAWGELHVGATFADSQLIIHRITSSSS